MIGEESVLQADRSTQYTKVLRYKAVSSDGPGKPMTESMTVLVLPMQLIAVSFDMYGPLFPTDVSCLIVVSPKAPL